MRRKRERMIAVLQFDSVSLPLIEALIEEGRLPIFADLRRRGSWITLETPAKYLEGSAFHSLYTGTHAGQHGVYYPWLWSASEQRVRFVEDFAIPPVVWERLTAAGLRSLIIDPYEIRPPREINGLYLGGWQFTNRVVMRSASIPSNTMRALERDLGAPRRAEEVYGRPYVPELMRLRRSLLPAGPRLADAAVMLLQRERFDLMWVTMSAAHLAGHRFMDVAQLSSAIDLSECPELATTLADIYVSYDEAMGRILAALPPETDIMVITPAGMGPNTSRSHLLPMMLNAILADRREPKKSTAPSSSFMWSVRSVLPTGLRAWIARALPDRLAVQLAARLELRGVDWAHTQAFMMPNDDAGFIRLNLCGRERDGTVDPRHADQLLDHIGSGLQTFTNRDGTHVVKRVIRVSDLGLDGTASERLPDLIIQWSDRLVQPIEGVVSPRYGDVPSNGWGTGRTGSHTDDAWAVLLPSVLKPARIHPSPHIVDLAATVCNVLGADTRGLAGTPVWKRPSHP
jgi:predicted AlkP superfamily phosphohydrolase/phosphomutase